MGPQRPGLGTHDKVHVLRKRHQQDAGSAPVLKVNLYRIDPSTAISKHIGETEKNLDELCSRAQRIGRYPAQ